MAKLKFSSHNSSLSVVSSFRNNYNILITDVVLFVIGMCNNDRVLEFSAVTAMIDYENDDRGINFFFFLFG